ncbi:MAG: proton-coupled thiamine transporter YuaJ [Lachnospiraceae bacterium]|nr:proton-coupled thiamine transporter YuaJ [Lachnospiraceae bacterium]
MFNFFAKPTVNSWGEDVYKLTPAGIITIVVLIVALLALACYLRGRKEKSKSITTKQVVFSGIAIALAMVTSYIKFLNLPMGGSITLCSMLFIVLIGYWYGPKVGIITAIAYGLLQFVIDPKFYSIPQLIVDYPLAFGALGISGFFYKKKHGLAIGYMAAILGRFVFAFLSGLLFFASYAPENMNAAVYSLIYNGTYIFTEAALTLVIILIPITSSAFSQVKKMAVQ